MHSIRTGDKYNIEIHYHRFSRGYICSSMGSSTSVTLEFEEIYLLPPTVPLPLDITKFISGWALGVPKSLMEFYALSRQLRQQLDHLPSTNEEIPEDWISQGTEWSQEVIKILEDMYKIAHWLLETRPADLHGNLHPIEEYKSDIAATTDEFKKILRLLRHTKPDDTTQITEALKAIRGIYLFLQMLKI